MSFSAAFFSQQVSASTYGISLMLRKQPKRIIIEDFLSKCNKGIMASVLSSLHICSNTCGRAVGSQQSAMRKSREQRLHLSDGFYSIKNLARNGMAGLCLGIFR